VILCTVIYTRWAVLITIAAICAPVERVMFRLASFASQTRCDWRGCVKLRRRHNAEGGDGHGCADASQRYARLGDHRLMKMLRTLCEAEESTARPGSIDWGILQRGMGLRVCCLR
jgi:hypothetical protein